jgi:hypothetical protein
LKRIRPNLQVESGRKLPIGLRQRPEVAVQDVSGLIFVFNDGEDRAAVVFGKTRYSTYVCYQGSLA